LQGWVFLVRLASVEVVIEGSEAVKARVVFVVLLRLAASDRFPLRVAIEEFRVDGEIFVALHEIVISWRQNDSQGIQLEALAKLSNEPRRQVPTHFVALIGKITRDHQVVQLLVSEQAAEIRLQWLEERVDLHLGREMQIAEVQHQQRIFRRLLRMGQGFYNLPGRFACTCVDVGLQRGKLLFAFLRGRRPRTRNTFRRTAGN